MVFRIQSNPSLISLSALEESSVTLSWIHCIYLEPHKTPLPAYERPNFHFWLPSFREKFELKRTRPLWIESREDLIIIIKGVPLKIRQRLHSQMGTFQFGVIRYFFGIPSAILSEVLWAPAAFQVIGQRIKSARRPKTFGSRKWPNLTQTGLIWPPNLIWSPKFLFVLAVCYSKNPRLQFYNERIQFVCKILRCVSTE